MTYKVTLTVTDVGGNIASVSTRSHRRRPAAAALRRSAGAGSTGGSSGAAHAAGFAGARAARLVGRAPIASGRDRSSRQTLRTALRKGLVRQLLGQRAGRRTLRGAAVSARSPTVCGISGAPATGLPAGSPPQVVIAKAILVTTKGGHSTVHIQFSKRTAAELGARPTGCPDAAPDRAQRRLTNPLTTTRREQRHAHRLRAAPSRRRSAAGSIAVGSPWRASCAPCRGTRRTTGRPAGRSRRPIETTEMIAMPVLLPVADSPSERQRQREDQRRAGARAARRATGPASGARRSRRCPSPPTCQREA